MHLLDRIMEDIRRGDEYSILQYNYEDFGDEVAIETVYDKISAYSELMSKDMAVIVFTAAISSFHENFQDYVKHSVENEIHFSELFTNTMNTILGMVKKIPLDRITEGVQQATKDYGLDKLIKDVVGDIQNDQ